MELVLALGLAKQAGDRFESVEEFAVALPRATDADLTTGRGRRAGRC